MNVIRIRYRSRQFWNGILAQPLNDGALDQIKKTLSGPEMDLFLRMQTSEQVHSYQVYKNLTARGIRNQDLLTAALLHDIGKTRHPLRLRDRVLIVLGKALLPDRTRQWGRGSHTDWRRIFTVAEQHASWGAEMAQQAGASPKTVDLIRRHQDPYPEPDSEREDTLLYYLQTADNQL